MRVEVRRKVSERSKKPRTSLWEEKKGNQILLLQTPCVTVERKGRISCSLVSRYTSLLSLLPFANFHLLMMGPPKHFRHRRNTTKTTVETFGRDQQIARPPEQCRARGTKRQRGARTSFSTMHAQPNLPTTHRGAFLCRRRLTSSILGASFFHLWYGLSAKQVGRKINEADEAGLAVAPGC